MDGQPAFVANSTEAEFGFYRTFDAQTHDERVQLFFMGCQQNSEHLITVLGPSGG